jgi:uncharacterized membrane protein
MMGLELLLLPLLIGLAIWYVNQGQNRPAQGRGDTPEEVLRRRFAGGDIDGEEYERRLTLLRR